MASSLNTITGLLVVFFFAAQFTDYFEQTNLAPFIAISLDLAIEPSHLKEVCSILKAHPNIHKLYQMTGSCSLHGHAMLPDVTEFETFMHDVIYSLPGLLKADCNTVIARIKDDTEIRV